MLKEIKDSRSDFDGDTPMADAFAGIPDPDPEDFPEWFSEVEEYQLKPLCAEDCTMLDLSRHIAMISSTIRLMTESSKFGASAHEIFDFSGKNEKQFTASDSTKQQVIEHYLAFLQNDLIGEQMLAELCGKAIGEADNVDTADARTVTTGIIAANDIPSEEQETIRDALGLYCLANGGDLDLRPH